MAKRRKSTKRITQPAPTSVPVSVPSEPIATGRIRQLAGRAVDSAIDAALDHVWTVAGGALVTSAPAVWLFIMSGQAPWSYPLAKYAAAFVGGWLSLTLLIALLASIRARRLRALEQAKTLKFVSQEKGYLDHLVNQKRGFKEYNSTLLAIGHEVVNVGSTLVRPLESVSKPLLEIVPADESAAEFKKRLVDVVAPLVPDFQPPVAVQPRASSFHDPAVAA